MANRLCGRPIILLISFSTHAVYVCVVRACACVRLCTCVVCVCCLYTYLGALYNIPNITENCLARNILKQGFNWVFLYTISNVNKWYIVAIDSRKIWQIRSSPAPINALWFSGFHGYGSNVLSVPGHDEVLLCSIIIIWSLLRILCIQQWKQHKLYVH